MNFKTAIILFLLMFLQSCALHYETSFGGNSDAEKEEEQKNKVYEAGSFR